jgi:dihydropteroate synthase
VSSSQHGRAPCPTAPTRFRCRDRVLDLTERSRVVAILNVTPDSFSDGGRFLDPGAACEQAGRMVAEGADVVELGGESSRPGAEAVPLHEELGRILPVLRRLRRDLAVPLAVDTYKPDVARVVLDEGAEIINDICGVRGDGRLAAEVARSGAGLVIMHMKGTPRDMQLHPVYGDVVQEVSAFFDDRVGFCERSGVDPESIVIDPGLGFGKRVQDNLVLIRRLSEFRRLGKPIMIGPSRKSFIGTVLGVPVDQRAHGTAACVAAAVLQGAAFVRVHEVGQTVQLIRMLDAIRSA